MIAEFVKRWTEYESKLRASFEATRPAGYDDIFERLVREVLMDTTSEDTTPDPARISVIDHGHYQGSRVFVVGAQGYQPSSYWAYICSYGSCSGCDTFEATRGYSDDAVTKEEIDGYMTMALHMVQGLRPLHVDYT